MLRNKTFQKINLTLFISIVKIILKLIQIKFISIFLLQGGSILKDKSNVYLPHVRSYYEPSEESLVSKSPEGVDTPLANTVEDSIVVNNIACQEFSYIDDDDTDSNID